jgi:hypothetical protein
LLLRSVTKVVGVFIAFSCFRFIGDEPKRNCSQLRENGSVHSICLANAQITTPFPGIHWTLATIT